MEYYSAKISAENRGMARIIEVRGSSLVSLYDDYIILRILLIISHITFLALRNGKRGWLTVCFALYAFRCFLEQISHVAERYSVYERIA